jgi:hypothetical protein
MMRSGTQFVARGKDDEQAYFFEFKKDETAAALIVAYADGSLQVLDSATDTFVTRPSVFATVFNGDFTSDITYWGDSSETGGSIFWNTGLLGLTGTGFNYAYADQEIGIFTLNVEHAFRISIYRGNVVVKVGGTQGSAEYWDVELPEGEYSLAFVPVANVWIRLGSRTAWPAYVNSVNIEQGVMTLFHPWTAAGALDKLQYDRSEDVLFVACEGLQQRRIERRNDLDMRSWGLALYRADDGPFKTANLGSTTLTNSGVTGQINLDASRDFFRPGHLGALFRLTHAFQTQTALLAGANQFVNPIRITGIEPGRAFVISISNLTASTLTLQRSLTDPGAWADVQTYTENGSFTYDDKLDNQIYWYRIGIVTGNYGGDTVTARLEHSGSQTGIVRITQVLNGLNTTAVVLTTLGAGAVATSDWAEGEWSDFRGWPVAVALHDGRLFWQCALRCQGSVSDAFHSYDDTVIGDSAPINRTTVASRPHWLISTLRLLVGSTLQEISVRASAFDEPLTSTAFAPRACSDRGSTQLRAVAVDGRVLFVGRDKRRVFLLEYDAAKTDFGTKEVTRLKQEMCESLVVDIAAQRQPDTRVYFVLGNGTVVVLVHEPNEEVSALVPFTFGGDRVERIACLPGVEEDKVYIYVARGGARCIEKFSMRSEAQGGLLNKVMDSHAVYSGAPTTSLPMPAHLEGRAVVVWADGQPVSTQDAPTIVTGGYATLSAPVSNAVAGLPYNAALQSAKLAYAAKQGTSLSTAKRVGPIGLVMADTGWKGVKVGRDFNHMQSLPATYRGRVLSPTEVLGEWDDIPSSWNGGWGADPRICITVASPYPCTLMGIALGEQVNEGEDASAPRQRQ